MYWRMRKIIMEKTNSRFKIILRTSVVGIIVNVFLAFFKMVLGTITHSIAVVLDGVNNLSDAASSLITIIGAALAGKSEDKKHPFGYGRLEYLSSLIISAIVLYAGITSVIESVKKIISPEESDYSTVALIAIAVAVLVKLALSLYTQSMGKKVNSDSLVASGKEAILDAVVSLATLITAIIFTFTNISLEAWLGAVIGIVIVKTGIELLLETISKLLGEPGDAQLAIDIKKTITSIPNVRGAYDLVIHNYGPDVFVGSVHVEVEDTFTVAQMDKLTRTIVDTVAINHHVVLSAVGFYSHTTTNEESINLEKEVRALALKQEHVKGFHGFYADLEDKVMRFDLVVSLDSKNRRTSFEKALSIIKETYPDYRIISNMDMDLNEAVN